MSIKTAVLGSTGSIGRQALDVAGRIGLDVCALSGNNNDKLLEEQCRRFSPRICWVGESKYSSLKTRLADTDIKIISGDAELDELAGATEAEVVLNSVMGIRGLKPTLSAARAGKKIAIANKETLVAGGELVLDAVREHGASLIPVDSEHSAIFQCLREGEVPSKLLLTASGGPFFGKDKEFLARVTPEQALKHPNWSMGQKITVDSATMMNKGLELIEAVRLFGVKPEDIDVIIHRESIIHSMVEYPDGAVIAQLARPDMRLCIQYAFTYPHRRESGVGRVDFFSLGSLSFAKPDDKNFPLLSLARDSVMRGGNIPAALNGANEEAVGLFLTKKIGFTDIFDTVAAAVADAVYIQNPGIEDILATDKAAREFVVARG